MTIERSQSFEEISHADSIKYLDEDWDQEFDSKKEALEYFGNLKRYSEILGVPTDQRERFIRVKSDELPKSKIDSWIDEFGSISEAVNYAENKLYDHDFELNDEWDRQVETVLDWEVDDERSGRLSEEYSDLFIEESEKDNYEHIIFDYSAGENSKIFYDGELIDNVR